MPLAHPRAFVDEYVDPAVEMYRVNRLVTHLASHAIAEMDNLAEVTALHTRLNGRARLDQGEATAFRRDLRGRYPVLGIIHDAHDSHKHGRLVRADRNPDPSGASEGQRPERTGRAGFFIGHNYVGGPLTHYDVLVVRLNDGTEREVFELLFEARRAWDAELQGLGL